MIVLPYLGLVPIDIFFTGIYFVLLDIVTEVYGYYEAKKMVYAGLLSYALFVFIMELVIHIHEPQNHILYTMVCHFLMYLITIT
jgi:uncharacterized PurR-regulated membrane protein YhhQ (DUF165 family)